MAKRTRVPKEKVEVVIPAEILERIDAPAVDPDRMGAMIQDEVDGLRRAPFKRALALHLGTVPGMADLAAFGRRAPDRHAQATAIYARLAGYTEKVEVGMTDDMTALTLMSDAALRMLARKTLADAVRALPPAERAALVAGDADPGT